MNELQTVFFQDRQVMTHSRYKCLFGCEGLFPHITSISSLPQKQLVFMQRIQINLRSSLPPYGLTRFFGQTLVRILVKPYFLESCLRHARMEVTQQRWQGSGCRYIINTHYLLTARNGLGL